MRLPVSGILRSLSLRIVLAPRVTETHTPTEDIYSLNWRCKKKGIAATSHLKTTPLFFSFFAFFEKKWVGRDTGNKIFLLVGLTLGKILSDVNLGSLSL